MEKKILGQEELLRCIEQLRQQRKKIVFTNGCFDLLHPGHIRYLSQARQLGDALIVGLNSDRSVRELKGGNRPILNQQERAQVLSGLESVTFVTLFDEDTPLGLITTIMPDVLVKGGDWGTEHIVGRQEVEAAGGKVFSLPFETGQSSSGIIERIVERYGKK
jgi:rfaE bifunctional protein nucleotidyltransferase chain/domain